MSRKAVISLTTGLEDPERVTVAFLVAVGAAEQGRPTLMFLTKEATRLALEGVATGVACDGCPPLADLVDRYAKGDGRYLVCPICFDARKLDKGQLIDNAEQGGTVPMWQWIGDDGATTFSYGPPDRETPASRQRSGGPSGGHDLGGGPALLQTTPNPVTTSAPP
jgi:predicted peroxiredoxin